MGRPWSLRILQTVPNETIEGYVRDPDYRYPLRKH
jgi:hypothetical protein